MSSKGKILIVEDSITFQKITQRVLSDNQYEFDSVLDGEKALNYLRENEVDLVLLDISMPGISGLEVLDELRRNKKTENLPVIMATASTEDDVVVKCLERGADDYITKPVRYPVLLARIKTQIERRRAEIELLNAKEALEESFLELEKANKELDRLNRTDALTGINNRKQFDEVMENEWQRLKRLQMPLGLLMIDIDHFKLYNDELGHPQGDRCLQHVAEIINSCASRATDTVTRYGGEEFAIILAHVEENALEYLAAKIIDKLERKALSHPNSDTADYVTVSIGAASLIPQNKYKVEHLIKMSDQALYQAKKNGRNQLHLYSP